MAVAPSASYSFTVRLAILNRTGMLGRVTMLIGKAGGDIGAVDLVEMTRDRVFRDITIKARDSEHAQRIIDKLRTLAGVKIANISDRTFLMHLGGKIEVRSKVPIRTRDDLSMAYTPGVARVCHGHQGGSPAGLFAHHQAEHRGRGHRRHRGARAGRHRPRGSHARDGGQGHALQGAGGRGRLSDLPRHQGPRPDRRDGEADRPRLRRHQPRGHLGPALLRHRGAAAQGARHPGLSRRPARHGRGRGGGAPQRAQDREEGSRAAQGRGVRRGRRGHRGDQDAAGAGGQAHHRRGRARHHLPRPARGHGLHEDMGRRSDQSPADQGEDGRRHSRCGRVHRPVRARRPEPPRPQAHVARTASSSPWPTPCPRYSPKRPCRTCG